LGICEIKNPVEAALSWMMNTSQSIADLAALLIVIFWQRPIQDFAMIVKNILVPD